MPVAKKSKVTKKEVAPVVVETSSSSARSSRPRKEGVNYKV